MLYSAPSCPTANTANRSGPTVTPALSSDAGGLPIAAQRVVRRAATLVLRIGAVRLNAEPAVGSITPHALAQLGSLAGRIVIDTTNQFGSGPLPAVGQTAAAFNAGRMPGARYTKSFNTLTSAFQARTAHRDPRVVQWVCGDDQEAKAVVAGLIRDAGYEPVDLGGTAGCAVMEAPRRDGAVYGEEYRLPEARAVVEAVRAGVAIPPTPRYP